jgi:hypothetical protein
LGILHRSDSKRLLGEDKRGMSRTGSLGPTDLLNATSEHDIALLHSGTCKRVRVVQGIEGLGGSSAWTFSSYINGLMDVSEPDHICMYMIVKISLAGKNKPSRNLQRPRGYSD